MMRYDVMMMNTMVQILKCNVFTLGESLWIQHDVISYHLILVLPKLSDTMVSSCGLLIIWVPSSSSSSSWDLCWLTIWRYVILLFPISHTHLKKSSSSFHHFGSEWSEMDDISSPPPPPSPSSLSGLGEWRRWDRDTADPHTWQSYQN